MLVFSCFCIIIALLTSICSLFFKEDEKVGLLSDTDILELGDSDATIVSAQDSNSSNSLRGNTKGEDLLDFEIEFEQMDGAANRCSRAPAFHTPAKIDANS